MRKVADEQPDRIPASFEFRVFFGHNQMVGFGRYWWNEKSYEPTSKEKTEAIALATEAANRVDVPFLIVDTDGDWIVIEYNDAQESGYAGVPPLVLWQNILELERNRL